MAEAILRAFGRLHFLAFSAGVKPANAVHPRVIELLKERDVSSEGLLPKGLQAFEGQSFDYVITLSDPAREQAATFPGADVLHWSFADPERSLAEHDDPRPFEHLFGGLAQRIRLLIIIAERQEREALHATQARAVLVGASQGRSGGSKNAPKAEMIPRGHGSRA